MTELQLPIYYIPNEIVDIIADFHDHEKYYKPEHKNRFESVLHDIIKIGETMDPISARIAKECWGSSPTMIYNPQENVWETFVEIPVEVYDQITQTFENGNYQMYLNNDDEENNFGLNYYETHYSGYNDDEVDSPK